MAAKNGAIKLVAGNSNPELAAAIASYLKIPLAKAIVRRFADMEIFVEIQENVRGSDVFVLQSTSFPANDHLMELLIIIDALRRSSARRITAVIPYFGYARQDRKPGPRTPISAKLVANLITVAGANRVLTIDLHAGQIQGFFNIPVDEMSAMPILVRYFAEKRLRNPVVVSPDLGNTKRARNFAEGVDASLAVIEKRRVGNADKSEVLNLIGSVEGSPAILVDDEIDTAGSITQAARVCIENGATEVYACCTHGILSGPAIERLQASPIREVVVTNTVPIPAEKQIDKLTVLSVASLIGETIQRIHTGASVSLTYRAVDRVTNMR